MQIRKWVVASSPLAVYGLSLGVRTASAGGFGIAGLDAFMTTFATGVTGLGIVIGGVVVYLLAADKSSRLTC